MDRMFYLSIVYDANGYDRFDLVKKERLQDIDDIIADFPNRSDIRNKYISQYNINKKMGRLCIIYEDLETKRKELREYHQTGFEYKNEISDKLTYAHIIPIIEKNKRLKNFDTCLMELNHKLRDKDIQKRMLSDRIVERNGKKLLIKSNKAYLLETENEKNLLYKDGRVSEAMEEFISRMKRANPDTKYFIFRSLMDVCELSINKKNVSNLTINEKNMIKSLKNKKIDEVDETTILEEESKNMEEFYTYHDLDEVIKFSPDSNRPIGSEGRKK